MAYIRYPDESELDPTARVADPDNIIQIHRVHPQVMRQHHDLYVRLMHRPGPLTRRQREAMAVREPFDQRLDSCTKGSRSRPWRRK